MEQIDEDALVIRKPDQDLQLLEFENGLLSFLEEHGLPTQSIFVSVSERAVVLKNVATALTKVGTEQRKNSTYISKFIAAIASGLFDAALNYLWDETIYELRRRVAQYDLTYFYDNAVSSEKRKKLKDEDDLLKLDDSELIHGAREIELISSLGFKHLDYVRYMRNWASAAHPNQNELTGLQLVSWLETCVREVISLPLSNVVVEIKKLLKNVKTEDISDIEAKEIAQFFVNLNQERVNNLAAGFFGIYIQEDTTSSTRQNVHRLLPFLWDRVDDATRSQFGIRLSKFVANNDKREKDLARQFLDVVSGQSYIPDNIRASEIQTAIENLLVAHRGFNNFHNEPSFARELNRLVGERGNVPRQIEDFYVTSLVEVFLTNGSGVSWAAEPIYTKLFEQFSSTQALKAVMSFSEENIASRLQFSLSQKKYREVLDFMSIKISSPAARELVDDIRSYMGPLDRMKDDSRIKRKVTNLQKILT